MEKSSASNNVTFKVCKAFVPLIEAFQDPEINYIVIDGGRNSGKSTHVAQVLLAQASLKYERILCAREIQNSIEESVHQILEEQINEYKLPFSVKQTKIQGDYNSSEFMFKGLRERDTARSIKSLQGINYCWVEEAQFITKKSLEILVPTIRGDNTKIIFTMNRTEEFDPVYKMFVIDKHPRTFHMKVNYTENPFCSEKDMEIINHMKKTAPEDYMHIYQGFPVQQNERAILPLPLVKDAMERKIKSPEGPIEIGADIAGPGKDRTAIYKRHGFKIIDFWASAKKMGGEEVANKIIEIAGDDFDMIKYDDTALCDIGSILKIKGVPTGKLQPVSFAEKAIDTRRYPNIVSEMWFKFLDILPELDLPEDKDLLQEMTSRRWDFDNQNRKKAESKKDYKKRHSNSPDLADAILLCFIGKPIKKFQYSII